jgi:hypothetical protein
MYAGVGKHNRPYYVNLDTKAEFFDHPLKEQIVQAAQAAQAALS